MCVQNLSVALTKVYNKFLIINRKEKHIVTTSPYKEIIFVCIHECLACLQNRLSVFHTSSSICPAGIRLSGTRYFSYDFRLLRNLIYYYSVNAAPVRKFPTIMTITKIGTRRVRKDLQI